MVKKFCLAVALIFAMAGVVDAQISVAPVTNSFRANGQYYLASAGDTISVPAWIYQAAKTDPVYIVNGEFPAQAGTVTVSKKVLASAELSADETKAVMTMTDGTIFESADMEWLKAINGQPFVLTEVNNSYTKKLWRNWTSMTNEQVAGVKEMTAYAAPAPAPAAKITTEAATTTKNALTFATMDEPEKKEVIIEDEGLSDDGIIRMALQSGAKVEGKIRTRNDYLMTK